MQVDKFIYSVRFNVLDCDADTKVSIIRWRPVLAMGRALIDVQRRELTMRVNDQQVTLNVLNKMKGFDKV